MGAGTSSGEALISCRQRTSGDSLSMYCCTSVARARIPLTFQVATFRLTAGPLKRKAEPRRVPPHGPAPTKGGFADAANDWTLLVLLEFSTHYVVLFRPARLSAGLATRVGAASAACPFRRSAGGLVRLLGHAVRRLHQRLARALHGLDVRAGQRVAHRLHLRLQLALGGGRDLVAQVLERLLRRVGEVVGAVANLDLIAPLLVHGLVRLRLLHGAVHVLLGEAGAGRDGDRVLLPRTALRRRHAHDAP